MLFITDMDFSIGLPGSKLLICYIIHAIWVSLYVSIHSFIGPHPLCNACDKRVLLQVDHFTSSDCMCNIMWRWAYDPECYVSSLTHWGTLLPFHWFYRPIVGRLLRFQAFMQGIGRHKQPEVLVMGYEDLQALSVYLGAKPFLTGDKPAEVDCALFGFLAQVVWNSAGSPYLQLLESDCTNLQAYCHRIKEKFWPDWGQCLNPPQSEIVQ
ncbi:failed axon connections homolog isoform X2 [Penaeus chinensis]|uniref:failed axon connections homolog isoform X2 n=1 Tax=Penaeus chinensis TaxID=139456 RepID=UPI001FB7A084|nr:failed axon connections homolog isoform X2 [Penaeus chinensis]